MRAFEVFVGVLCGMAVAGWAMVILLGIAYLVIDPFRGPFL